MRRKLFIILFLICSRYVFAQDFKIPEMDWQGKTETINNSINLLKLEDKHALVIKIGYTSYWTKGQYSKYIVFQNDGKVKRFEVFQPNSPELKPKVKRKKIKKKEYQYYWKLLQECITEDKYKIDKSKLNITEKKDIKNGTVSTMVISDGTMYSFWMYQGNNYIAYGSYMPASFIEAKFPGWQARQQLVDLMTGFEDLIQQY